ncbi:hypothetical protein D3C72_1826440 [compost metagenome]
MVPSPLTGVLFHFAANNPARPGRHHDQVANPRLGLAQQDIAEQARGNRLGLGQHPVVVAQVILPALVHTVLLARHVQVARADITGDGAHALLQHRVEVEVTHLVAVQRQHAVVGDNHQLHPLR